MSRSGILAMVVRFDDNTGRQIVHDPYDGVRPLGSTRHELGLRNMRALGQRDRDHESLEVRFGEVRERAGRHLHNSRGPAHSNRVTPVVRDVGHGRVVVVVLGAA